ncbi:1672_t:CDS:2 [Dentiscutata erythropus]|uniref:1672_t:CDS:1 n=1 Tax=Dentiscutata erythropus TaxID=1348616 RepID=A0A9N9C8L7_9GLOM|nr:1672_t:CDS:2 [Dentiscutata erythropus]
MLKDIKEGKRRTRADECPEGEKKENAISTNIQSIKEQIPPLAIFCNETNEANEATETDKTNEATKANKANEANEITIEHTQQGWEDMKTFES